MPRGIEGTAIMPRTPCIILRKTPFQETGLILACLSPDFGRIDLLCRGIRKFGKRSFPVASLFREISIDFREPKTSSGLVSLRAPEPILSHDALAEEPSAFLAACSLASFLLRNIRPMVSLPDTYRALSRMLNQTAETGTATPWLTYVKLVFLCENGLVSVPPERQNILDSVTAFAVGDLDGPPPFRIDYQERFLRWIEDMAERCSIS